MEKNRSCWFPAKKYSWGWGIPTAWQGWVVLIVYAAVATWLALQLLAKDRPIPFFIGMSVATVAFVAVCWLKGEPPRLRCAVAYLVVAKC